MLVCSGKRRRRGAHNLERMVHSSERLTRTDYGWKNANLLSLLMSFSHFYSSNGADLQTVLFEPLFSLSGKAYDRRDEESVRMSALQQLFDRVVKLEAVKKWTRMLERAAMVLFHQSLQDEAQLRCEG